MRTGRPGWPLPVTVGRWRRINRRRGAEALVVDVYWIGWRPNAREWANTPWKLLRRPWQAEAPQRTDLNAHRGLTMAGAARAVRRVYRPRSVWT